MLVFLLPLIVKAEHHHERSESKAKNENHHYILKDKCVICNYEFSVFRPNIGDIAFQKENQSEHFCNNYDSAYFSNLSRLSFLLRAPPMLTNRI
jgi:hypothetical protein